MATQLDQQDLYSFLQTGHRTAKIACVKADGSPVVSPVWFVLDNDELVFTTMNTSLKYKLISRDPRVSVCVENDAYPYGFATIKGVASAHVLSQALLQEWTTRIAARYVPGERVGSFGERNAVEGEMLIRVRIEDYIAFEGIAD